MKQLTTYNRAAAYLNTIFDLLNARYFEGALSRPIITIQSTPKAYGHYTLYDAWSVDGDKGMREINIGAGTLSRPIENVVATLLHEIVHYWNDQNGVKDCSRGNTYHNKRFKAFFLFPLPFGNQFFACLQGLFVSVFRSFGNPVQHSLFQGFL